MAGMPRWIGTLLSLIFNKWGATTILLAGVMAFVMFIVDKKLDVAVTQSQQMVNTTQAVVTELKAFHEEHDRADDRRNMVYQQMLRFLQLQCVNTATDYLQRQGCLNGTPPTP